MYTGIGLPAETSAGDAHRGVGATLGLEVLGASAEVLRLCITLALWLCVPSGVRFCRE